jgi:hypothetical protein
MPCVYLPGPAPAVTVANSNFFGQIVCRTQGYRTKCTSICTFGMRLGFSNLGLRKLIFLHYTVAYVLITTRVAVQIDKALIIIS